MRLHPTTTQLDAALSERGTVEPAYQGPPPTRPPAGPSRPLRAVPARTAVLLLGPPWWFLASLARTLFETVLLSICSSQASPKQQIRGPWWNRHGLVGLLPFERH